MCSGNLATLSTCSSKILPHSCRDFLKYVKSKQVKERLFWHLGWSTLLSLISKASREKFYLVKQTTVHDNYDIFVISESWIDPSLTNNNTQIPGYVIFRQDRGLHKSGAELLFTLETHLKHRSSKICLQLETLIPNNSGLKSSAGN